MSPISQAWCTSISPSSCTTTTPRIRSIILTPEQSVEVLRQCAPYEIGHDPIILVYDLYATNCDGAKNYRDSAWPSV